MGRSWADLGIFLGKRLLQLIPVLLGVLTIAFVFTHIAVHDPCAQWYPKARGPVINHCIQEFGLNQPLIVQYGAYLNQLAHGNWGTDVNAFPVITQIGLALPATIELVIAAMLLMILIGIPLGVIAATSAGRWPDHAVRLFYLSGWAMPTYLIGVLLAIGVAAPIGLGVGEFSTQIPPFAQPTGFSVLDAMLAGSPSGVLDALDHLFLPAFALAFLNLGIATRMTRSSMLEVLPLDYVKTARMKGLSEFRVIYGHALRNSLITTTTVLGITAGVLLSNTVVIELLFRWPGIGNYAYNAITQSNFAGEIAVVIVFAIAVVISNLIADVLYGVLDPRVEWR